MSSNEIIIKKKLGKFAFVIIFLLFMVLAYACIIEPMFYSENGFTPDNIFNVIFAFSFF